MSPQEYLIALAVLLVSTLAFILFFIGIVSLACWSIDREKKETPECWRDL